MMNQITPDYRTAIFGAEPPHESGAVPLVAAVIDPMHCPSVHSQLAKHCCDWVILNPTEISDERRRTLPVLARLDWPNQFTDDLLTSVETSVNIFLRLRRSPLEQFPTRLDFLSLASHLGMIPHVLLNDTEKAWLRYYDPSVFCYFMDNATIQQQVRLFGYCIERIWAFDARSRELREFEIKEQFLSDVPLSYEPMAISASQIENIAECHYLALASELVLYLRDCADLSPEVRESQRLETDVHNSLELAYGKGLQSKESIRGFIVSLAKNNFM